MSVAGADGADGRVDPRLQVVRGTPDDLELAALVAGLVAASAGHGPLDVEPDALARTARARWTARGGLRLAARATPGPDAWRWSLHP